ncbi:MAG: 2-amino-4-hydroxy-6-hydroxymethyldihydropteridine diphosphokinase [Phocaeicola sp.]|nr:2-amino-4-hydroxy-6-hydroxymethyldihydropteridine diphosphokinase [Phocaeicola sp.]
MHKHYEHNNDTSCRNCNALIHSCIICVGSNYNAETNIISLEAALSSLIPGIHWGIPVETPAEIPSNSMSGKQPEEHTLSESMSESMSENKPVNNSVINSVNKLVNESENESEKHPSTYINRAAEFSTPLSLDELNSAFKEIEKKMGRTATMRQANIVPIDIDILIYDNITVRPDNLKCNYVVEALKSLKPRKF